MITAAGTEQIKRTFLTIRTPNCAARDAAVKKNNPPAKSAGGNKVE
jgi:hypothetical protein